jgi:hypothetical protein
MIADQMTITILNSVYDELVDAQLRLSCLQAAGVDSWDGCDLAADLYEELKKE